MKATVSLQHFDLVAVGILDEEEAGDQRFALLELDDFARLQIFGLEAPVLGIEIVDDKGDMAVAGSEIVRLGACPC